MKRAPFPPRLEIAELQQAVRRCVAPPAENEEGYDPHVEHRDYERLKEEMRKTKEALAKAQAHERELADALAEARSRPAPRPNDSRTDWKRAIVLSEILGTPRSRKK